jgi:hypothetical protein
VGADTTSTYVQLFVETFSVATGFAQADRPTLPADLVMNWGNKQLARVVRTATPEVYEFMMMAY